MRDTRSILVFGFAFFLLSTFCLSVRAQNRKPIGWRVDKDYYMVYTGAQLIDPFGYELKREDKVPSPRFVHDKNRTPFYIGMVLPEKRVSPGSSYQFVRKAPKFHPLVPYMIGVRGERKEDTTVDGHDVYHLHHELKLRRLPKRVHDKHNGLFIREGTATADIYYDPDLGAVRKLVIDPDLTFAKTGGKDGGKVKDKQTYTLKRHHMMGTNAFDKRVDEAIEKGVKFLKEKVKNGENWKMGSRRGKYSKGALALLAMLESGLVERDSDLVKSGMKQIFGKTEFGDPAEKKREDGTGIARKEPKKELKKDFSHTYQEGLRMMAMEAYHNEDSGEKESDWLKKLKAEKEGKTPDQFSEAANVPPADRDWMHAGVRWIFQSLNKEGGIRYTPDENSFDNSNNQYAALGLYAAQNLKIPLKNIAPLKQMISHWMNHQGARGPTINMGLSELDSDRTGVIRNASARGWSYRGSGYKKAYGHFGSDRMHMTAGGVGSLRILRGYLQKLGALRGRIAKQSRIALRDGLAWMAHNWQMRPYPFNHGGKWGTWQYYMLYGIERAAMLNNLSTIGDRRWYPEGAELILTRPNNWLGDVVNTSFVILFLKRATNPIVITKD